MPSVPYSEIPDGWTGIKITNGESAIKLSSLYTADSKQPELKGVIAPNAMGCIGYVSAGGKDEKYQKFMKFVKFGLSVVPITDRYDLYVFKSKTGYESVEFRAAINPPALETAIDPDKKFVWEVTKGQDKVELIFDSSDTRKKDCKVKAKGVAHLSQSADDVEVKVSWSYGAIGSEKTIKFTVRSIYYLNVESSTRIVDNLQQPVWQVVYSLRDQLGAKLPDNVCAGLRAVESFTSNVWDGVPDTGSPTLKMNRLKDTFAPKKISWSGDGHGRQTIAIDHMRRTHTIKIPWDGDMVNYSEVVYEYNR